MTWLCVIQKELGDVEVVIGQSRRTANDTWKLLGSHLSPHHVREGERA